MRNRSQGTLLRLHICEGDKYRGKPLHEAIVNRCMELDIAGATVFRGLEGFTESADIRRPHLLGHDLPIVINVVDTPEKIERLIPELDAMVDEGVIATSSVEIIRVEQGNPTAG